MGDRCLVSPSLRMSDPECMGADSLDDRSILSPDSGRDFRTPAEDKHWEVNAMFDVSDLHVGVEVSKAFTQSNLLYGKPQGVEVGDGFTQSNFLFGKPHLNIAAPMKPCATPHEALQSDPSTDDSSKCCPEVFSSGNVELILRSHKEEVMKGLKELLSRYEGRLEHTLSSFINSSDVQEARSTRPNSLEHQISTRSNISEASCNPKSPVVSQKSEKYISLQEMREQCLAKAQNPLHTRSNSFFGTSFSFHRLSNVSRKAHFVANSFFFELTFAALICVNSVLLGVEVGFVSSSPTEEVPHVFRYLTICFSLAFLIELFIRLLSEGGLLHFLFYSELRAWNWFDLFVVISSLIEVGFNLVLLGGGSQSVTRIMRMARMSRLGRILRVARIVRFVNQLRVLVISIMSTLQTLLWALFLVLILIYVFGVLMAMATADYFADDPNYDRSHSEDTDLEKYWGSLQTAMYTLFMSIAGGLSWETPVFAIAEVHWVWAACFTCFIIFASFVLINVMTAIVCQSAIESAQKDMDAKYTSMCSNKQKHIRILKRLFQSSDPSGSCAISMKKLIRNWENPEFQAFLHSMELEPDDCWTFFQVLDQQNQEVNAAEFVEGCLRLKGQAKAFNIAVMTYELRHLSKQNVDFMNHMHAMMQALVGIAHSVKESPRYGDQPP